MGVRPHSPRSGHWHSEYTIITSGASTSPIASGSSASRWENVDSSATISSISSSEGSGCVGWKSSSGSEVLSVLVGVGVAVGAEFSSSPPVRLKTMSPTATTAMSMGTNSERRFALLVGELDLLSVLAEFKVRLSNLEGAKWSNTYYYHR